MPDAKITSREGFIYLEPKKRDRREMFAQCGSCRMFTPHVDGLQGARCIIHGSRVEIGKDDSCGFWVDWPTPDGSPNPEVVSDHSRELAHIIPGSVKPEESGLVDDRVQCHRCTFFDSGESECGLFAELNHNMPDHFDLPTKVKPNACCNMWTEGDSD